MNNWEKSLVTNAFKRDFGLQETLKHLDSPNKVFRNIVITTLSERTGLSPKYLRKHIEEIKEI